jgi:5-hydroxyisourate hydrolase
MDQKLSLSTHILDTTKGKPADNVTVKLYKLVGGIWVESNFNGKTDKDGRIKDFSRIDDSTNGVYKLRFEVAEYFQRIGAETLYPFIEVSVIELTDFW